MALGETHERPTWVTQPPFYTNLSCIVTSLGDWYAWHVVFVGKISFAKAHSLKKKESFVYLCWRGTGRWLCALVDVLHWDKVTVCFTLLPFVFLGLKWNKICIVSIKYTSLASIYIIRVKMRVHIKSVWKYIEDGKTETRTQLHNYKPVREGFHNPKWWSTAWCRTQRLARTVDKEIGKFSSGDFEIRDIVYLFIWLASNTSLGASFSSFSLAYACGHIVVDQGWVSNSFLSRATLSLLFALVGHYEFWGTI